jgi:4-amino-4-deoxy-L-arabinose transferase-like glycosyltransferase
MQVPASRPGFARWLAAIAAGGLAVRLLYILALTPHLRGQGDSRYYHELAILLGHGHGFVDPGNGTPTALHPPLFPLLLALPSWLGLDSWQEQRVVVALVGTATIVVVGLVARRVAGDRAGLMAAAVAAAYPVLIAADGAVMSEALLGLLVASAVLVAYGEPSTRRSVLLGALIGLAALTRGEALLLLLLLFPIRRPRRKQAALVLACLVVLTPWTIRNFTTFDKPVALSTNEGNLIAGANCHSTYYGHDTGSWDLRCVPGGPTEDESRAASRFRHAGLTYAGDHLGRLPVVLLARLGRTFELYQPIRQAEHAEMRADGIEIAGAVAFFLLLPLGLYGFTMVRPRAPLVAPFGLAIAATLVGYGVPRFRHPADVALAVLAGVALAGATSSVASRRSSGEGGLTSRFSRSARRSTP